jgi:c-di-AMP phosphodiesterase-like protein
VLSALTPGPEVAGDTAVVVVSMAAGARAFAAATAVEAFGEDTVEVAFAVVTGVEAFAVDTAVIEAATVAGDMDAVTATEAVGGTALASG